jgi:hypothetical protein
MFTTESQRSRGKFRLLSGVCREDQHTSGDQDGPLYRPGRRPDSHPVEDAQETRRDHDVVVVGAHGGAGTSTLTALLRPAWDMGAISYIHEGFPPVRSHGRPLLVVCHGTVPGTRHAITAVSGLEQGGQDVTALVVVSDGLPEPPDATARLDLLADRVGAIVRMPYVSGLRLVDDPAHIALPAKAYRALARIRAVTDPEPLQSVYDQSGQN